MTHAGLEDVGPMIDEALAQGPVLLNFDIDPDARLPDHPLGMGMLDFGGGQLMNPSRLVSVMVENKPGVLNRVASMIRRRGFNIDSSRRCRPRTRRCAHDHRRPCRPQAGEQATSSWPKLIDVITIDDITELRSVSHELMLIGCTRRRGSAPNLDVCRGLPGPDRRHRAAR